MEELDKEYLPSIKQVSENYYIVNSGKSKDPNDRCFVIGMSGEGLKMFHEAMKKKCSEYFFNKE